MSFPYFYGRAAEQYAFYRIPKLLFSDERFEALSTDAKLLYGMLIDRMELSMKNGWTDKDGRVFIYFTLEDARERLKCGTEKIVKLFAELDSEKGIGLIECVRQGLGKPNIIYVKNFMNEVSTADRYPCMVYHFQVREWLVEVQNELLGHAIERLTPYRQEIILLYFFLGFKNKEIAALYGCNAGKISYHKMRAVRQIRSEMEVRRHE